MKAMKREFTIKGGLARSRRGRKEKRSAPGSFLAALRLCAKTAIVCGLGSALSLFSGCAPADKWPSVERLQDGRQGFVIQEKPDKDTKVRAEFERAVAMLNEGKNDEAIELLKRVIYRSPGLTAPHIDIALAYLRTGKPDLAEQHLKAALAQVRGHPVASNEYGLLLRRAGRFGEAREIYEKAIDSFPDYLPARKNLGILCDLYLEDPECALKQFERYSERMPEDEKVKIWIAELRIRLGRQ